MPPVQGAAFRRLPSGGGPPESTPSRQVLCILVVSPGCRALGRMASNLPFSLTSSLRGAPGRRPRASEVLQVPTTYVIRDHLLEIAFSGRHSVEEDLATLSEAARSPDCKDGTNLLLDLGSSREDRAREEIIRTATALRELFGGSRRQCALLASDHLQYGLARMLSAYAGSDGLEIRVFRQQAHARAWLRSAGTSPPAPGRDPEAGDREGSSHG